MHCASCINSIYKNKAMEIRRAEHATFVRKKLSLTSPTSGARSVDFVLGTLFDPDYPATGLIATELAKIWYIYETFLI
jgi:hypothetical protein